MALVYTTDELLTTVKARAKIPNTQSDGTSDADLLRWLNEAMDTDILPFMISLREDYYVLTEKIDIVNGQERYRIPKRALGNKIREIKYRNSTSTTDASNDIDMNFISREHLSSWQGSSNSTGAPGFFFEDVDICLAPSDFSGGGSLIVSYFFRPGDLVLLTEARRITAINASEQGINQVTLDPDLPTGWTTSNLFDIHSQDSGAEIKAFSRSGSLSTDKIVFLANIDGTEVGEKMPIIGDYVTLENEIVVPALPKVMHPVLAQSAVCSILESMGDYEGGGYQRKILNTMFDRMLELFKQRAEGEPSSVVNPDSVWYGGSNRYSGAWN